MAAPEWFKKRGEKCAIHNVPYQRRTSPLHKNEIYCPKCREAAILEINKKQQESGSNTE